MLRATPATSFETVVGGFATGLTGTIGVRIRDGAGGNSLARTTAGIAEDIAGSGIYRATLTAPSIAGQYWVIWDNGSGVYSEPELLLVASSELVPALPSGFDLCTLADVTRYVPGYTSDTDTDDTLQALITAESTEFAERTGREFVAIAGLDPRSFDISRYHVSEREIPIGDATTIATITQKRNGATVRTITSPDVIQWPRNRQSWQPITELRFPNLCDSPVLLQEEDVFEIAATWGFPTIPADVREACAKLVIVRYVSHIALPGTKFADAVTGNINVGGLFASASAVVERYQIP